MTQFTLIKVGNKVFDSSQQLSGTILEINYKTSIAKIKTDSDDNEEVIYSKLFNLTQLSVMNQLDEENQPYSPIEPELSISIKYFNPMSTKLQKIVKGDWIDLRSATNDDIIIKKGEFKLIPLGVAMKLPKGYEAVIAPRGSTFKNFGVIETNSIGIVDNSYSGNDDQWFFPAYALRDTVVKFDERICQFRIQKSMPTLVFNEVDFLDSWNRGGHGSTGTL